jgi:hypothetical protein
MKSRLFGVLVSILILAGCGGGTGGTGGGNPPPTQQLVDPSGNWVLLASDAGGNQFALAGVLNLTPSVDDSGGTVIANNLEPIELPPGKVDGSIPPLYSCGVEYYSSPGSLLLSSGLVQNDDNLTGEISFPGKLGGFTLNATLAANAQSFTGTYANMPGCVGIAASGTLTGTQLTSVTGAWSGSLQPCNSQGKECTPFQGTTAEPIDFTLRQNNATGTVSGTYLAGSLYKDIDEGTINGGALGQPPNNYLTGYAMQFHFTDNNTGLPGSAVGNLLQSSDRSFSGIITMGCAGKTCPKYSTYLVNINH